MVLFGNGIDSQQWSKLPNEWYFLPKSAPGFHDSGEARLSDVSKNPFKGTVVALGKFIQTFFEDLGFVSSDFFYGLYPGKSPLNYPLGEYFLLKKSIFFSKIQEMQRIVRRFLFGWIQRPWLNVSNIWGLNYYHLCGEYFINHYSRIPIKTTRISMVSVRQFSFRGSFVIVFYWGLGSKSQMTKIFALLVVPLCAQTLGQEPFFYPILRETALEKLNEKIYLVGGFNVYFHPYFGTWSNLTNICSIGLKPPTR